MITIVNGEAAFIGVLMQPGVQSFLIFFSFLNGFKKKLYRNQNGYIMANSGHQYKGMPYRMAINMFFPDIKANT